MQFRSKDGKRVSVDLDPATQAGGIRVLVSAGWTAIEGAAEPFVAVEQMSAGLLPQPLNAPQGALGSSEINDSEQLDPIDSDEVFTPQNGAESVVEQVAVEQPIAEALEAEQTANAAESDERPSARRRR